MWFKNLFDSYKKINTNVLYFIAAAFCMQCINASFFLIMNIFMAKIGYDDPFIANAISYRFLASLFIAVPFGFFIKGKRLRPIFQLTTALLPLMSFAMIYAIEEHIHWLLYGLMMVWGIIFSVTQISILPFILRNEDKNSHSEAIALHFASWSSSIIFVGLSISFLSWVSPDFFTDKRLLQFFSIFGTMGIWFAYKVSKKELVQRETKKNTTTFYEYDWGLIARAVFPVLIIATGAGLTVPFFNLFFFNVFGLDSAQYSLLGSATSVFVLIVSLLAPKVKQRFGYEAITTTQSFGILVLILLGSTDFLSDYTGLALYLAIGCYLIRQPLMSLANPMTSEMAMYYVGKKNQEMLSAIVSSVWAGSWFFSSQIFRVLRVYELRYGTIFYITAAFYTVGVFVYYLLVLDYRKREKIDTNIQN